MKLLGSRVNLYSSALIDMAIDTSSIGCRPSVPIREKSPADLGPFLTEPIGLRPDPNEDRIAPCVTDATYRCNLCESAL